MQWLPVPKSGADVSPVGWSASATGLNGEGFARNSWNSHKEFQFSWYNSMSRKVVQELQNYANGTYGRGLLYFVDPHTYKTNIFPAHWADPSMGLGYDAWPLVSGLVPNAVSTPNNSVGLPVRSAQYTLTNTSHNVNGTGNDTDVFLPIPDGMVMYFGAWYSSVGSTGVYYQTVNASGGTSAWTRITPQSFDSFSPQFVSGRGVRFKVGTTAGTGSVTLSGMRSFLVSMQDYGPHRGGSPQHLVDKFNETFRVDFGKVEDDPAKQIHFETSYGAWFGGQGNTGCRMNGRPTIVLYNGVNGGQQGTAVTLIETGAWE